MLLPQIHVIINKVKRTHAQSLTYAASSANQGMEFDMKFGLIDIVDNVKLHNDICWFAGLLGSYLWTMIALMVPAHGVHPE